MFCKKQKNTKKTFKKKVSQMSKNSYFAICFALPYVQKHFFKQLLLFIKQSAY